MATDYIPVRFNRWYKKDENCFPVSYILQPVTTWIPNYFNDSNLSLKQEAQREWQSEYDKMKEFLKQASKKVFKDKDHDLWHKYVRSGEIVMHCCCFFLIECVIMLQDYKKKLNSNLPWTSPLSNSACTGKVLV